MPHYLTFMGKKSKKREETNAYMNSVNESVTMNSIFNK